jgi:sporulation protein YlmC with PRC-barrel domain
MKRINPVVFAILGACLASQGVAANADTPSSKADLTRTASTTRTSGAAASMQEVRASKLLGTAVRGRDGSSLGEISDLIVDTSAGRVHYAVLSVGGVLGIGDKQFAVPLSALDVDARGELTVDADRDRLQSAPAFEAGLSPNWNDRRVGAGQQRAVKPGNANGHVRRASDIIRTKVKDSHGGDVGKVKDLVVDLRGSRVQYVVVDFDRAWNPNDKLVALPPGAFADGASLAAWQSPEAEGAGAPRNAPPMLALLNPGEPTKGTASAVNTPGALETRPPIDPKPGAMVQPLPHEPLPTTTSYADDEALVFRGTREELRDAPAFDPARYPG